MASNNMSQDSDDTEILQFNLTNPEQLCEQLKNADLDDQETDALLSEALRINKQLKEALRNQQLEEEEKPKSGKVRSPLAPRGPLAFRNPKQSTLPPIVNRNDNLRSRGGTKDHHSKSVLNGPREASASKRKGSANKSKPAWDDRFSFS